MKENQHLKILRRGVREWNAWRKEHPDVQPNLVGVGLDHAILPSPVLEIAGKDEYDDEIQFDRLRLDGARLDGASLVEADLLGANLDDANLEDANLSHAVLDHATLNCAKLDRANLHQTSLVRAELTDASLHYAHLDGARFRYAVLASTSLVGANFGAAHLADALLYETVFANVDLSEVHGLERASHTGPSIVEPRTLARFQGNPPEVFLRGCGLSDWEIEAARLYAPDLSEEERTNIVYEILRILGESPIQINPLFISYSRADAAFVEAVEERLKEKRIRFWRDVHHLKAGRLDWQIEQAIRHHPIVLLVLSERSVESDWVEWEVAKARELAKKEKRDVLCPVALDEAWKTCSWEGPLRHQIEKYNILDFSKWQDADAMERQFRKLVDGLGLFYPSG